jgi:hypothetical protein
VKPQQQINSARDITQSSDSRKRILKLDLAWDWNLSRNYRDDRLKHMEREDKAMSDVYEGEEQADGNGFNCASASIVPPQIAENIQTTMPGMAWAVSNTTTEVSLNIDAVQGAVVEAQGPAGNWASIGSVGPNQQFLNGAVPKSYQYDSDHIRIRLRDNPHSEVVIPVRPAITGLSASVNADGTLSIEGTTTLQSGRAEAFSLGKWKSIGTVAQGKFSNLSVPWGYSLASDTVRVRVQNNATSGSPISGTFGFPHSRAVLIQPTVSGKEDSAFMSWRLQKADYQPTGYFAPAGSEIEVWVWGNADDLTLLVGIQGMADRNNPSLQSENMRATRLVRGQNFIRDPLGGVIHIRNLSGPGAARIVFGEGASPIPYYIHGTTTAAQWVEMLNASDLPEVELVGKQVVIASFRATALKLVHVDPGDVVDSHEEVLRLEAEVSGLDGSAPLHTSSPLRLYAVEALANAPPYATTGYIGLPYSAGVGAYAEALIGGKAHTLWVTLHEYGHHHQNRTNDYGPFGEVSVNLYSLAVAQVYDNEYTNALPLRWPATQQWLAKPRPEKDFIAGPDPMAIFEQLRKGFGQNFLPKWHRYIRENPCASPGVECFIVSASIAAAYNLTHFFADWGVLKETDTDVWEAVNRLGYPYPLDDLTAIRPYVA